MKMQIKIMTCFMVLLAACAHAPPMPGAPTDKPASSGSMPPVKAGEFEAFCASPNANCQHDIDIDLVDSDGSKFHKHFDLMPPSVQPGFVTIYPGQTIKAAASFQDGKFSGWIEASTAKPDDIVLTFA